MPESTVAATDNTGGRSRRGRLIDWTTQQWVRATGRVVTLSEQRWLEGPVGDTDVIGPEFFQRFAERRGLEVADGDTCGLLESFTAIRGPLCDTAEVLPEVARFYERTSEYDFDVWSEWSGVFRPFGGALAALFSQRLQQLNVPLSPLDTRLGITSQILQLVSKGGETVGAAWIRESRATGRALYVGSYSLCRVPGYDGTCLRVAFPLPNGYALVVMKPESHADGSLTIRSEGSRFGDAGFYFFVEAATGRGWARYVASLKESIHVFVDDRRELRADHTLSLWGATFLRLHYRMRRIGSPSGRQ